MPYHLSGLVVIQLTTRPRPKQFNGAKGRILGLALALKNSKFDAHTFHVTFFSEVMMLIFQDALYPSIVNRVTFSL